MTPHMLSEIRRLHGAPPEAAREAAALCAVNMGLRRLTLASGLTPRRYLRHNYTYHGCTITPPGCQSRRLTGARRAPSSPRGRPGSAVCVARVFRSAGSRAGEVRNAPSGGRRGPTGGAHGRRLWVLASDVLSDAGRLQATGDGRLGASETRAAWRPQTRRHGDGLCGDAAGGGPGPQRAGVAATDSRAVWSRRAPAESRACLATRGKKTPLSDPPDVPASEPPAATLVASYEALRRMALGPRGLDDGPSLGLAILLRHGVAAWLCAWATCPRPSEPVARPASPLGIPSLVHTELAQLWAHIALSHQEAAAWI